MKIRTPQKKPATYCFVGHIHPAPRVIIKVNPQNHKSDLKEDQVGEPTVVDQDGETKKESGGG